MVRKVDSQIVMTIVTKVSFTRIQSCFQCYPDSCAWGVKPIWRVV